MQRLMLRLDAVLRRRRWAVVAVWALALLAALPFAARQSENLTGGGFDAPGSDSRRVEEAVKQDFPGESRTTLLAVLVPRPDAPDGALREALGEAERKIAGVDDVRIAPGALDRALAKVRSEPGEPVVLPLLLDTGEMGSVDVARELRDDLDIGPEHAGPLAAGQVGAHVTGQGALWTSFQELAGEDASQAEARAFPLIALVLLAAFGSFAAAALPLGLGLAAVAVTGAVVYGLSLATEMSVFVTNITSMLGIGVAVDYSLFVLARYREEIRAGRDEQGARAAALATSGVAVIFSGLTVMASVAGLFLVNSPALRSLAIGAIVVVAVSVLAASTLVPVLIALLGRRAYEPGRVVRLLRRDRPAQGAFWERWSRRVMRRPVLAVLGSTAVLLVIAIPALDLQFGNRGLGQLDRDHEYRDGSRAAATVEGPGAAGPVRVRVAFTRGSARDPAGARTVREVVAALGRDPAVSAVRERRVSRDRRSVLISAVLRVDPESERAREAVARLRESLPAAAGTGAAVELGGSTAVIVDFDELVSGSMWKLFLFVLGLSFFVLLVLLRSIVLPLKAVLMNLLSVAAAYGALVAVFQWGWLEFLGLESAPFIDTITPPLVLALTFGLSMDYEVFLLTRIRERYALTGDNRRAVAEGLATSARTITSAALIMVVVFLAFVSAGMPAVQRLGFASAVAIALDATLVRLVLVPAAMELLGRWNWWLPRPLARVLPAVDLERLRPAEASGRAGA